MPAELPTGEPGALSLTLPQALLFDMDGTLVASEEVWYEAEHTVMRQLGVPWGPEHQRRLLGGSLSSSSAYMSRLAGGVASPARVARMMLAEMETRLRAGEVAMLAGARELLSEAVEAGVPCALVSSSYRVLIDAVLDGTGLRDAFAVTVAGDEVERPKPHPDCYLRAIGVLGADPAACVVLEDSEPGVRAARAAGCPVVVVPSLMPVADGPGRFLAGSLADVRLADLSPLRLG